MSCEKLDVPETYFDNVPPNPRRNEEHIVVKLGIDIFTILGLSEVESTVSLQYVLMLEWVDSRVMFNKRRIPLGYRMLLIKQLQNNAIELQVQSVTVTPSGHGKSVTVSDCHSKRI